ncbi:methyltransferase domain-containing protein [Frigoribacterium sp. Leaf263]|uniref:methyltransferase domain-containing protein n=1 Tax=Frigoribacterium sp. Leaf263 TaxID=1736313 RepID=UPI000AA176D9|nr:methyltransferase domain-containing protein [Frigoribacterium sp. Leaf263]
MSRAPRAARVDLDRRDAGLVELMDDPDCDLRLLERTYGLFPLVNALVGGWGAIYRELLRPMMSDERPLRLLDLGSGGGDVARGLMRRARKDGLRLEIVAADPDARAHGWASEHPLPGVEYRCVSSGDLVTAGERFDVVVSNHVLHHLDDEARASVLDDSERLAERLVVHVDIRRARTAYLAYWIGSLPLAGRSFVRVDGLRSIRRSFRPDELRAVVPPRWRVVARRPFRLWLVHAPERAREEAA